MQKRKNRIVFYINYMLRNRKGKKWGVSYPQPFFHCFLRINFSTGNQRPKTGGSLRRCDGVIVVICKQTGYNDQRMLFFKAEQVVI